MQLGAIQSPEEQYLEVTYNFKPGCPDLTGTPRRDYIIEVLIDLHWLKVEERIVYKMLILTFNAFIDRTAPMYLCELIEQQKSSTNKQGPLFI